jgi:hypothetical protein
VKLKQQAMYRLVITVSVIVSFFSCNDKSKKGLMPEIKNCDSAIVMYYHTPGDPRFFNMTKVRNMDSVSSIVKDANQKLIPAKDSCITQGKIYFYGKGGAVYPVYFSRMQECMTLSFMKTGEKYFAQMSNSAGKALDEMEKRVVVLPGRKE